MQKKLFYADCVKLAESYFIAQAEIKLDVLKHDKTKEIMKLHELQEQLKMKKKIGISYHSIQKIADGKTPTPQPLKIGSESKVSSEASKKIDSHFDELDKLFATSQNVTHSLPVPSDVHINPKIVITDEQILPPLPVTPSFAPVKRKRPVVDVYATWKKMNSSFSSQQSDRRSQPSQQSQKSESSQKSLSQVSQLSPRSQEKLDDCHSRKDEQAEASSKFREVSADDHPLLLNESGVENSSKDAYQRRDIVQVEEVGTNSENVTFDVPNGHVEPVTEDAQVLASSKNTANTPANEPQKSVRFNLDKPLNSTKETKRRPFFV
ncbi:uncharacterized protein LOC132701104 [Cylas formicarius]|uniref:uncharacterized protein LOC132701104 n=1 Tax=Cylas formicarius TaxID=197179 RepID=UPI002958A890|nr:uncharacterized protein LOC132701104 [Cylas formicarius]